MNVASARAAERQGAATGDRIVAIDVLLLPDATMRKKAIAANARLREDYPQGYTLGTAQTAHVSLVHAFVPESSLPAIEKAIAKIAADAQPLSWELTATGYTSADWGGIEITTIGVERTPALDELQTAVLNAVETHRVLNGTAAAFNTNRELPKIEKAIVKYVDNFARDSSGTNYHPHVTVGVAHANFVTRMKAEPFKQFPFKPVGVAIYQLGAYGTVQKKLWEWNPKPSTKRGNK